MEEHSVGFISSWKALTSAQGWYKPILVLALVAWIPILGTIIVLGYAYEWARIAAWGGVGAPRRQGIDYGKLLATGGRAFLVLLTIGIVCGAIGSILFDVDATPFMPLTFGGVSGLHGGVRDSAYIAVSVSSCELLGLLFQVASSAFLIAAMMRSTIYDRFSAGWRIDRVFQMIGRDLSGAMRVLAAFVVACAISFVCSWIAGVVMSAIAQAGFASLYWREGALYLSFNIGYLLRYLFTLDPLLALVGMLFSIGLSYVGLAIAVAMQLIVAHVVGVWFWRFDVGRWGLSSDPLPEDVPVR